LPKYVCVVIDKNGQKVKQKVDGPNHEAVSSMLKSKGCYLVSIKEETIFDKDIELFGNGILSSKQVALFARQFSMLLKAGVSVSGALDILRDQLDDKAARKITEMPYQEVLKGLSLSDAMKATKRLPELFVSMIEAGEAGGFLDDVMERMAIYYEKDTKVAGKVKNAMIYPCIVLIVTIIVVYVLVTQVVPQFAEMFSTMTTADGEPIPLPWTTQFLMDLSNFLNKWWLIIFLVVGGAIFGICKYISTPRGKFKKDTFLMTIPLIKSILLKSIVARFTRTLSIMVRTGVPMLKAIEFSAKVVNNKVVERGLMRVADEVAAGKSLSVPIQNMKLFPKMVISLVKTGEETGALDEMMDKCADFYDDEVANLSERLTTLLEPMIIIILAGTVGFIVMSVLQPMFTLYNSIG